MLARDRSFRWLDPSKEWFWSNTGINPLLHRIRKILSVANPIRASDLQAGIVRSTRMKGFSLPIGILLEFCRQAPGLHARNETIVAKPAVNPNDFLSPIEQQIIDTMSQNGGTLTVSELKSMCSRLRLNQTTCYLYLVHSPFILKYGHRLYGLIGCGENFVNEAGNRNPRCPLAKHGQITNVRSHVLAVFRAALRAGARTSSQVRLGKQRTWTNSTRLEINP